MTKGAERHNPSPDSESQRLTPDELTELWVKIEALREVSVDNAIELVVRQIERLQLESATKDDTPQKYAVLRGYVADLNEELAKLPDSIEI